MQIFSTIFLLDKDLNCNLLIFKINSGVLSRSGMLKSLTGFEFCNSLIARLKNAIKEINPVNILVTNWYSGIKFKADRV